MGEGTPGKSQIKCGAIRAWGRRIELYGKQRGIRSATTLALAGLALAVTMTVGEAGAASPCANSAETANALVTTSPDGKTVHGSACADRIVVTSPAVREV